MIPHSKLVNSSAELIDLFYRIQDIKRNLLDFSADPKESLFPDRQDKLKAFKLLVHAEFESYLEEKAKFLIDKYHQAFITTSTLSSGLITMLAYSKYPYSGSQPAEDEIDQRVLKMCNFAVTQIGNNHGIKEQNTVLLFHQVGVPIRKQFAVLLGDLDSYGSARGEIAHKGIKSLGARLIKLEEILRVERILKGFLDLDQTILATELKFQDHAIKISW